MCARAHACQNPRSDDEHPANLGTITVASSPRYLESEFLSHQLESQRELALIISKLGRIGTDGQALLSFNNDLGKASH